MKMRVSLIAWIAAVLMLAALASVCVTAASTALIVGDVDGSGRINSLDVRALMLQIVGTHPLDATRIKQADIDGDGRVTTIDARELLIWIAEGSSETAPTITTTTTTTATTTTTRPPIDDDGYYDNVVKP